MPFLRSSPFSMAQRLCEWLRRASSRSNQFCVIISPTPTKKSGRLARSRPDFMMSIQSHPMRQLSLRSRGGFFLRRSRDFLHGRSSISRSGATTAALRSRAARGGWLAAADRLSLARGRSTGGGARSRSGLGAAGRMMMLMTALRLRSLAATNLRGFAAVTGFSGTAESGQDGQGYAERNQLHRTTHVVSLSLHYDGPTSRPGSIEVNKHSPHGSTVQDDSRPTLPGR